MPTPEEKSELPSPEPEEQAGTLRPEYQLPSLIERELDHFSQHPGAYALLIESVRSGDAIDRRTLERQLEGTDLIDSPAIDRTITQQYILNSSFNEALRRRLGESNDQIDHAIDLAEQRVGQGKMRDIAGALRLGAERFTGRQVKELQDLGPIPDQRMRTKYHLVNPVRGGRRSLFPEYTFPVAARNMITTRYRR